MKKKTNPIPTDEDREQVLRDTETLYERTMERLATDKARERIAREEAERRRERINRLSLGLLGRH